MLSYILIAVVVVAVLALLVASIHVLKQYERAVQFRLGKLKDGPRGPGLVLIIPLIDRIKTVSLRIVTMPIQSQGIITRDNVSVDIAAVAYYRIKDPVRSVVAIEDVQAAINQIAQTTLRSVVGQHTLDETLSETDKINQHIREILDVQTEEWGTEVTLVELKDIQLPDSMKRAMAKEAEAEREKRAKIIAAEGEALAAGELAHASDIMMAHPLALQLQKPADADRYLRGQELDRDLPVTADEHDPGVGLVPGPRNGASGKDGREPPGRQRPAHTRLTRTADPAKRLGASAGRLGKPEPVEDANHDRFDPGLRVMGTLTPMTPDPTAVPGIDPCSASSKRRVSR